MKESWTRQTAWLTLELDRLTELIQPIFQGCQVVEAQPTVGGLVNTNYRLQISGCDRPILLRLFVRNHNSAPKEFALSQLVKDRVPIASFLFFAESNPITGHPYALMEWMNGSMLSAVAQSATASEIAEMGFAVGAVLADIQSFKFEQTGFFDQNLQVTQPIGSGRDSFLAYIHQTLLEGQGHRHLGAQLTQQFWTFAQNQSYLLDDLETTPNLVHSDYDGSNILLHQTVNGWTTSAVLDWEFAYSGSSLADIGHILRPPIGSIPQFEHALINGFRTRGGVLPGQWKRISKLLDLLAWVDFLNRAAADSAVINSARHVLLETMNRWSTL